MALRQIGEETLTVDNTTATGFTEARYWASGRQLAILAECRVETAPCRVNAYTTPTAAGTEGSPLLDPGDSFKVAGFDDIKGFKAIASTSTSTVLRCQFYGAP